MRLRGVVGLGSVVALFSFALFLQSSAAAEPPPCFDCHDQFPQFAHGHEPAVSGDCTACHVDHGDAEKLMLVKEGSALCYECHDNLGGKKSVHQPVADGECLSCHNPHGSANEKMLVAKGDELCKKCHDGADFSGPVVHDALSDGCAACHMAHNSDSAPLLKASLTLERLALFEASQAALCFDCHDAASLTSPESEDTNFRQGKKNLHAWHLNGGATVNKYGLLKKKEGQTCVACHLPHASMQGKLVRNQFDCKGTACYTMRFTPHEKGGTCVVGCHKPQTYSHTESALQVPTAVLASPNVVAPAPTP